MYLSCEALQKKETPAPFVAQESLFICRIDDYQANIG